MYARIDCPQSSKNKQALLQDRETLETRCSMSWKLVEIRARSFSILHSVHFSLDALNLKMDFRACWFKIGYACFLTVTFPSFNASSFQKSTLFVDIVGYLFVLVQSTIVSVPIFIFNFFQDLVLLAFSFHGVVR